MTYECGFEQVLPYCSTRQDITPFEQLAWAARAFCKLQIDHTEQG